MARKTLYFLDDAGQRVVRDVVKGVKGMKGSGHTLVNHTPGGIGVHTSVPLHQSESWDGVVQEHVSGAVYKVWRATVELELTDDDPEASPVSVGHNANNKGSSDDRGQVIVDATNVAELMQDVDFVKAPVVESDDDPVFTGSIPLGQPVRVFAIRNNKTADPVYVFWQTTPHVKMAVKVTPNGGTNGDNTKAATYTYDVTTLDGRTLGTAIELARPREWGPVTQQASGSYGEAFWGEDGLLKLWDAGEIYDTDVC